MKSRPSLCSPILLALAFACHSVSATPPPVLNNMDQAMAQASSQHKLAFIMAGRATCSFCRSQRKMIAAGEVPFTTEQFVMAEIDADNREVMSAFRKRFPKVSFGDMLPFVVIAGPNGEVLTSYSGGKKQAKLTSILEFAITKNKANH